MESVSDEQMVVFCEKPAVHAAYNGNGYLVFLCAKHLDGLVQRLRGYETQGKYLEQIRTVRKLNPGLL
jgi:hypothetical protein